MAGIDLQIFVDNLKKLMTSDFDFIGNERYQLQSLHDEINIMVEYHRENLFNYPERKDVVAKIGKVVFEAENVIDQFVVDALMGGHGGSRASEMIHSIKSVMAGSFFKVGRGGSRLSSRLRAVKKKMKETSVAMMNHSHLLLQPNEATMPRFTRSIEYFSAVDEPGKKVGIDKEITKIVHQYGDGEPLQMIAIIGFPVIGKTTLASAVYNDSRTEERFNIRAWVFVSQEFSKRDLLIAILKSAGLFELDKHRHDASDDVLGEHLLRHLKDKRYLVVFDDMWTIEAWNQIQRSFPDQSNGSKVIFTTRETAVAKQVPESGYPTYIHRVHPLSEADSWKLLKKKVFQDEDKIPPLELEKLGVKITKRCDGVPFAINEIGGLLAHQPAVSTIWERFAEMAFDTHGDSYKSILLLSYNLLSPRLKACFLYMGSFPSDYDIPVRKLIWMLVAEGFVGANKEKTLEDVAESYIQELVDRNLVIVSSKKLNGATKACRVPNILRRFCLEKAKEDIFLSAEPSYRNLDDLRRLFTNSEAYSELYSNLRAPNLRSLVCFPVDDDPNATVLDSVFHENRYKLLKVLDLLPFKLSSPNELGNSVHLRYLALSFEVKHLPVSISKLFNLESLIISTSVSVNLPRDIWKLVKLRHLYNKKEAFHFENPSFGDATNGSPSKPDFPPQLKDLQTLYPLCCCEHCLALLVGTPKIRKLGLRGNLVSDDGCLKIPEHLGLLQELKSLKCISTGINSRNSRDPFELKLPISLKKLTLQKTFLKWEEIAALATLENLEVLKLLDDACVVLDDKSDEEPDWNTTDQEFPRLKYLKFQRLNITAWEACDTTFPSLEVLVLEECRQLVELPIDLSILPELEMIEVRKCNSSLESFAQYIEDKHEEEIGDGYLKVVIES